MSVIQDPENIFVGLGARLKAERQRLGLKQPDFGKLGGATGQTQMRYETGQQTPKLDYLFALAGHGVDAGYVVTGVRTEGRFLQDDQETEIIGIWRNLLPDDKDTSLALLRHFSARDADRSWQNQSAVSAPVQTLHSPRQSFRDESDG